MLSFPCKNFIFPCRSLLYSEFSLWQNWGRFILFYTAFAKSSVILTDYVGFVLCCTYISKCISFLCVLRNIFGIVIQGFTWLLPLTIFRRWESNYFFHTTKIFCSPWGAFGRVVLVLHTLFSVIYVYDDQLSHDFKMPRALYRRYCS